VLVRALHLRHHTNDNVGPLDVILMLLLQIAKVSRTDVLDLHWQEVVAITKPLCSNIPPAEQAISSYPDPPVMDPPAACRHA